MTLSAPSLLIGIHSGAPFVWDAWTVGIQWWRRFGEDRVLQHVDVLGVASPPAGDDGDVVEPVRPPA